MNPLAECRPEKYIVRMRRVGVWVPRETWQEMEAESERTGLTLSELVRQAWRAAHPETA